MLSCDYELSSGKVHAQSHNLRIFYLIPSGLQKDGHNKFDAAHPSSPQLVARLKSKST